MIRALVENTKVAATTASSTAVTGYTFDVLGMIPDDIGKLASLVGIVLSLVLIYTHWRKGRADLEKTRLEVEVLKMKLKEGESD